MAVLGGCARPGGPEGVTPARIFGWESDLGKGTVGRSGFYPTLVCHRHDAPTGEYTVSMEGFAFREAQAPAPR